ncbi:MAG: hypothetical protein KA281_05855, partial [Bacteroidia bacterium]|nr:hypothetical protein [Bacteroidia bacterium]
MKKILHLLIIRHRLLLCVFILLSNNSAKASHAAAADITYVCLPGNQVKVRVDLYSDCAATGQQVYTTLDIQYESTTCTASGVSTIPLLSGGGIEVPTGDYPPCGATTCNGGSAYG